MRDYDIFFPAVAVAVSPLLNIDFSKIAADICFVQLLSFCIPIISRYHPVK